MNVILWVLAILLAGVFVVSGAMKLIRSREQQIASTPYVADFPQMVIRGIGVLEILGAIGLIVPPLLGVVPVLASFAAAGLALTMVFAALVHVTRGDGVAAATPAMLLAVMSVFVAWMRFGPYAF